MNADEVMQVLSRVVNGLGTMETLSSKARSDLEALDEQNRVLREDVERLKAMTENPEIPQGITDAIATIDRRLKANNDMLAKYLEGTPDLPPDQNIEPTANTPA